MMHRILSAILVAALLIPVSTMGQDDTQGELVEVVTWRVDPMQIDEWESAVKKIVAAAEAAKLGTDRGWFMYTKSPTDYTLVFPISGFGYFDDPQQWMRSFEGTEGEATLKEAFGAMQQIELEVLDDAIAESVEGWTHRPDADMAEHTFAHVDVMQIRNGQDDAFDAVVKDYITLFGEIGYPFQLVGHKTHFGSGHRAVFVTFGEDLSAFYGESDLFKIAQEAGQMERMNALFERLKPTITGWDHYDSRYRADLSYWPAEAVATN